MSSRGSRGRGSENNNSSSHKSGRSGGGNNHRYNENSQGNNRSSNNSYAANAAPPPSIDESPVRNNTSNNTGRGGKGSGNHEKGNRSNHANSGVGTPTVVSPPEPVGPSPYKFGPQSLSPLNADTIGSQTPSNGKQRGSVSGPSGGFSVDASPREKESSSTYEKPPIVPSQRSSFEVTATPTSKATPSLMGASGLGGATGAGTAQWNGQTSGTPITPGSATTPYAGPPTPHLMGVSNLTSPVDREVFVAARAAVHNAPRPVLAALLTSILDDYPALGPLVKYRYERAMSAVATQQLIAQQQQQQIPSAAGYWGGGGSMQNNSVGNDSPSRKRSFRGRGGHEDDQQQICGVHGALRSIKHLRLTDNGLFECVPGFHCLESSKENSNCVSPVKGEREHSYHGTGGVLQATAGPFIPAGNGRSYSSPPSPPPGTVVEPFVVQGLFQPGNNQQQGMVRQNTLPPMGGPKRSDEDDNLEELLKNLHLATNM